MFDKEELNDLYNFFGQAREQQKKENFNYFMTELVKGFENDLNRYFQTDKEHYEKLLNNIKSEFGFKVLRNSQGIHKIKL